MFFGETWPMDDEFFNDCRTFDDGFYSFFNYTHFMIRKSKQAREGYRQRMMAMFQAGRVDPSDLLKERMWVYRHVEKPLIIGGIGAGIWNGRHGKKHDGSRLCSAGLCIVIS